MDEAPHREDDERATTPSRWSGSERGSPHNWSDETRRAYLELARVAYERKFRPKYLGEREATWKEIAALCPWTGAYPAARYKYYRLKHLYWTPGGLPQEMHDTFSKYLKESDPHDVVTWKERSRRGSSSFKIHPMEDMRMMRSALDARLWRVNLEDREERKEAFEENVWAKLPGPISWTPVMVRTKIQQLSEAFEDSDHDQHMELERFSELKKLVKEYVERDYNELQRILKRFAREHLDNRGGEPLSFDDVLVWGSKRSR